MGLFNVFQQADENNDEHLYLSVENGKLPKFDYISSQHDYLSKYLKDFENKTTLFSSNGKWAMHHLIAFILKKHTEPAHVMLSTFSLSTEAAHFLINYADSYLIKSLKLIFDTKTKSNNAKAIKLIQNKFEIYYTNIHAKVTLIHNDNHNITIIGSGNLTANPRIETGVIFTDKETFNFNLNWLNESIKQ